MLQVHPVVEVSESSFFLRQSNIPLCAYVTFCFFHSFFPLWTLELLPPFGCYQQGKHLFDTLLFILLNAHPQVELLGHMVILCLIFLRDCHVVFLIFPAKEHKGSSFSTLLPTLVTYMTNEKWHFNLHFSNDETGSVFSCL